MLLARNVVRHRRRCLLASASRISELGSTGKPLQFPINSNFPPFDNTLFNQTRGFSFLKEYSNEKQQKTNWHHNSLTFSSSSGSAAATVVENHEPEKQPEKPQKKRSNQIKKRKSKATLQQELESALKKGGEAAPLNVGQLDNAIPKFSERALEFLKAVPATIFNGLRMTLQGLYILITDPPRALAWLRSMKGTVIEEAKHYWLGFKLLWADVSTSTRILRRVLAGNPLSRREKRQLERTTSDMIRLVPFSFFIIIPFMEFLLPVALKLFPNMLPSTFQDSYQKEETMKKQLQLRLSLAEFLQNTVKDVLKRTRDSEQESEEIRGTAQEVLDFIVRAQSGEPLNADEILKFAALFNDELMLDNISRPQLVGMCRFMALQPYGNDNFLRFQLRNKIRQLKQDDKQILWEGLDTLTKEELQSACLDRGMRSTGLTKTGYKRQMKQWLDLSISRNVPASLLIISRALNITAAERPEVALAASMSSMDEEVVAEVALEAATADDGDAAKIQELKLESIRYQNELIADEEKDREEQQKKDEEIELSPEEELKVEEPMLDVAKPINEMFGKPFRELTLDEVSALESLVFKSSVAKERKALVNMKQFKREMDTQKLLASGRIGAKSKENKAAHRMMSKLDSMIMNLEEELQKVDDTIGDRLNFLDKDRDGVLSAEELTAAIKNVLREHNTFEDASRAVTQIDENGDGKVTVKELVGWIERRTNLLELTGPKTTTTAGGGDEESNTSSTKASA